jgi:hypothetical protein
LDVVLGVAVTGRVAQLALVGSASAGHDVIDQSVVDLADNPIAKLTETVVGTNRLLADENHRLVATRLCWSDHPKADQLRRALEDSGVQDVVVLSESQATTALSGTTRAASSMSVQAPDDPTVALARGAAMAAGLAEDATAMGPATRLDPGATAMAPALGLDGGTTAMAPAVQGTQWTGQVGPGLAYSMAGDSGRLPMAEEDDGEADTGPLTRRARGLAVTDVVLGIAVAGSVARLVLAGPAAGGNAAIQHSVVDLAVNPFQTLIRAVGDAQHLLAGEGQRLVATRLYSPDQAQAEALRQALAAAGVPNVALVSQAEAVTALLRSIFGFGGLPGSVVLLITGEAATLFALGAAEALATVLATVPLVGADAATAAVDMLLAFLRTAPFAVTAAFVAGTAADLTDVVDQLRARSPLRVEALENPAFAIARGAAAAPVAGFAGDATAMAPAVGLGGDATAVAPAAGDATAMAPATQLSGDATGIAATAGMLEPHAEEPQLAYSMTDDGELLPADGIDEFDDDFYDEDAEIGRQRLSGRSLLISNAVVAFAVIGFASLAVAVVVTVRPTAASEPVVGHQNAAPGKFMPLLPTQQQAPVPPPPADQPNAGYQGGIVPDTNGYIPPQLVAPGRVETPVPVAPVPAAPDRPGTPGFVPNPNGPIPIPIIIPFPGWRPPYPGWIPPPWPTFRPPIGPTTTFPTPTSPTKTPLVPTSPTNTPLTPTSPTKTPLVPTTPTNSPSTPTNTPTSAPPTSSKAPYTSTQTPTSAAPPPSTPQTTVAPPHTQTQAPTQQTVAPKPVTPQQPVTPKPVIPQQPVTPKPVIPQQPVTPKPLIPQVPRTPSGH